MTSLRHFDTFTDARWTDDHSAATHLRSPVTLSWVEMKPPVPHAAFAYEGEGSFWDRFGRWCLAAWDVGRCDPTELSAGPVVSERPGWKVEPVAQPQVVYGTVSMHMCAQVEDAD